MSALSNTPFRLREAVAEATNRVVRRAYAVAHSVVHSVHPSADDAWLIEAELQLYRHTTRYTVLTLVAGAFFVAQACSEWIPWATRTAWWILVAVASIATHAASRRLDRAADGSLASIRYRARGHVGLTFVFTLLWCSMSVFLWAPNKPIDHMVIVLILACSLAGSIALNAVHPATAVVTYVLHAVFTIAPLAFSHSDLDRTLAWLALIYAVVMAGQFVGLSASMEKMLGLEHERTGLVGGLLQAKTESDRERARAAAAARAKSQFLSNMSHELRTPMNAILGFSELIKVRAFGGDVEKYSEYAEIIHDSGRHLLDLINDMLDLSKIEGGKMSLREVELDLPALIVEAVDAGLSAADHARISLSSRIAGGFPHLVADERAMRQIVGNLLSNALKFTPPGGSVTAFAHIEVDGRLAFGVEDTGIGVAPEDQASVFERFGKGRHDVTTTDKGTGLGLAVVKGFAEAHDGSVALESGLGTGTCVTVYLPALRACIAESLRRAAG